MNIGKKAIFLTAAAGALVVGGAGGALAHGNGTAVQTNHCDTATGAITSVGGAAPTGDINIGADCINYTNTGAATFQSNECDTATGVIAPVGAAAPTGDINVGATCTNISVI